MVTTCDASGSLSEKIRQGNLYQSSCTENQKHVDRELRRYQILWSNQSIIRRARIMMKTHLVFKHKYLPEDICEGKRKTKAKPRKDKINTAQLKHTKQNKT